MKFLEICNITTAPILKWGHSFKILKNIIGGHYGKENIINEQKY